MNDERHRGDGASGPLEGDVVRFCRPVALSDDGLIRLRPGDQGVVRGRRGRALVVRVAGLDVVVRQQDVSLAAVPGHGSLGVPAPPAALDTDLDLGFLDDPGPEGR